MARKKGVHNRHHAHKQILQGRPTRGLKMYTNHLSVLALARTLLGEHTASAPPDRLAVGKRLVPSLTIPHRNRPFGPGNLTPIFLAHQFRFSKNFTGVLHARTDQRPDGDCSLFKPEQSLYVHRKL